MPIVGLVGGAGGVLLSAAGGAAADAVHPTTQGTDPLDAARRYAVTANSPAQQRKDRLVAMFEAKHC